MKWLYSYAPHVGFLFEMDGFGDDNDGLVLRIDSETVMCKSMYGYAQDAQNIEIIGLNLWLFVNRSASYTGSHHWWLPIYGVYIYISYFGVQSINLSSSDSSQKIK